MSDAPLPPAPDYRVRAGALHFLQTEGPRRFVVNFSLVYAAAYFLIQAFSMWTQGPVYEIYLRACTENGCDFTPYMDELQAISARTNLFSLILVPFGYAIWVVFEGSSQRRYMRAEGFTLKLGADEGRLAVVGLIWFALLIAGYFALLFIGVIPAVIAGMLFGMAGAIAAAALAVCGALLLALYFFARLSAASALTVRDRTIRFFESWRLTRGTGFRLMGSYLILFVSWAMVSLAGYAVLIGVGYALVQPALQGGDMSVADAVTQAVRQPAFLGPMALITFGMMVAYGVFAHAFGGPAAALVKRETLLGNGAITGTFD